MIEKSREQGWSELKDSEAQVAGSPHGHDNLAIWEELKRWDPRVFTDYWNVRLTLGRLIVEGGPAQVFEASMHGIDKYAAKVYKMEGFSLADLQRQWPVATKAPQSRWAEEKRFVLGGVAFGEFLANCSEIKCGTFLWDGRFAFVMLRYWGDLRTLVDLKLSHQLNGPPLTVRIMHNIAQGIRGLHARGVLHRDLKAANVLVEIYSGDLLDRKFLETDFFDVVLADFESSMLVQGTGFWRAPEVLQELLKQPWDRNPQMWTVIA